jgi:LuxR family transcriptional regulator, maltose regulon positive regulatory protein
MTDQGQPLLQTKLHRPHQPRNLVERLRLEEWLNNDIDGPLTLVCAPAGFGKTTLVATWLERITSGQGGKPYLPSAWLSLDENDSDLNLFLRYFIAAMRTIFKEACERTLALLQARQQPPNPVLYASLVNELVELPGEAILVLDDYHTIRGTEVHNLLIELVRHWPRSLHLVLISRIDPPIPLTSLRAKGLLHEIRTQSLRFTPEETAVYLSHAQLAPRSQKELDLMEERFEGWPAGLHLATLSLRSASSQESVLTALSSKNPNITRYLADEVLSHQLPEIHSFMLKTSILDRFTASLCETLIGEIDNAWNARACLDWIDNSELFLIPLDERREWYRYHHLFQELLQQRASAEMGADQVTDLHHLASAWFEEHGLLDEALHHALAAGDLDLAASQMSRGLCSVINREDWPTLERWLHLIPEEVIKQRPDLLMIRVWLFELTWRLDLQAQAIQQVTELIDSGAGARLPKKDQQILRGQILMPRAQYAFFSNQPEEAIVLAKEALALLPPTWTFVRGAALLYQGLSMQANGKIQEAEKLLFAEYEFCSDKTDIYPLIILQTLGYIYLWAGQHEKARQIAQLLIQGATRSGITIMRHWGDYFQGMVCYQCNELDTAGQYFDQIVKNRYIAHGSAYRDAVTGLTLIHQIRRERSEAWKMVESLSQFDLEQRSDEDERTRSLRARLMLLQGNLESASRWADTFTGLPPDQAIIWLDEPQVTRVRVLLASGIDADLQLAQQILDVLDEIAERTHNTRYKIEFLALRALVLDAQGDTGQADAMLIQALDLSRPGGFIRVFADLGKPMQRMLRQIARQDHSAEMIRRILAAFEEDDENQASSAMPAQPRRQPSLANSTLDEPLTRRELEVLTLLREPLSIKEIALKLNISHATASRHTVNIYSKLGVNGRWNAVARAEELNLLSSD